MSETLKVEKRGPGGSRAAKKLRAGGVIPAILYGHGDATIALSVPADAVRATLRHGSRVVDLAGAVQEKAFIRAVQWDPFGNSVLHVDFTRVSEHERVKLKVQLEMRGQAPGAKAGGVVELLVHELEIDCEAVAIPEKLAIGINELQIGDELTVANLKVPAGVNVLADADLVLVHCIEPAEVEEAAGEAGPAEPELLGRRKADEEEESGE